MLEAAMNAWFDGDALSVRPFNQKNLERSIGAALAWLAEHPIGPTEVDDHILAEWSDMNPAGCPFKEWIRRMFIDVDSKVVINEEEETVL
jgi:hypothetical protein